jgi:hypothetical protein
MSSKRPRPAGGYYTDTGRSGRSPIPDIDCFTCEHCGSLCFQVQEDFKMLGCTECGLLYSLGITGGEGVFIEIKRRRNNSGSPVSKWMSNGPGSQVAAKTESSQFG